MKKAAIALATDFLSFFYALFSMLPAKQRIVCLTRKGDDAPVDFTMIRDYCAKRQPPWDVVILAKKVRNPVTYGFDMIRQTYYIATSKAVVVERISIVVCLLAGRIKAPVIQIWHAIGNMKKFGYAIADTEEGHPSELMELTRMHRGYDAIAISSMAFCNDFAAGFDADPSIMFEAPLPRVDLLTNSERQRKKRDQIMKSHPELQGRKTIVYAPTYRKVIPENQSKAMDALLHAIDFSHYNFIFKPHPLTRLHFDDDRVVVLDPKEPNALYAADYVITDYSTVMYEAGLLHLPVYLYAYDWESYDEKRGFNIDFEHDVPVLFTDDPAEIMDAIGRGDFDFPAFREFMEANVNLPIGESCTEHLCEAIISMAETGRKSALDKHP